MTNLEAAVAGALELLLGAPVMIETQRLVARRSTDIVVYCRRCCRALAGRHRPTLTIDDTAIEDAASPAHFVAAQLFKRLCTLLRADASPPCGCAWPGVSA